MAENGSCGSPLPVEEIDLRRILGLIWNRRLLVLTLSCIISGGIVVYDLVCFAKQARYESFAYISGDVSNPDFNGRTISEVVGMGICMVDTPGNAMMLRIRFAADDEAEARRMAEEGAEKVLKQVNQRYSPILETLERELKSLEGQNSGMASVRAPLLVQIADIRVRMAMRHEVRTSEKRLDVGDVVERWFVAFVLGLLVGSVVVMVREQRL